MSSIQERLQLKRVPLDTWNIREQLCLASAVVRSGDQNWMSVSRALKTVGEPNRPADWYSQKSCAAQYGALLEHVETPKRKKRSSEGAVETPQESILKRLTQERIVEIQKNVAEMTQQYEQIKNEISEARNPSTSEERIRELWANIETAKRARERESARRAAWLKEREERRARVERTWRPPAPQTPTGAGGTSPAAAPSSPLLTSLLKSSPVVTTPQHITHPANVVDTVSPSAGAPTLSMLLDKCAPTAPSTAGVGVASACTSVTSARASAHDNKHAAIEHIKSQLVQIERNLTAAGSTRAPPPLVPAEPTPALDIDDIEIKAEDVYAFRDVDIHIPPVAHMHKSTARPGEKATFKKDDLEIPVPAIEDALPAEMQDEMKVDPMVVENIPEEALPVDIESVQDQLTQVEEEPPQPPEVAQEPEVKIAFPEVKFPTPEIKVIQSDEQKVKEEVKEPEAQPAEEEAREEVSLEEAVPAPPPEPVEEISEPQVIELPIEPVLPQAEEAPAVEESQTSPGDIPLPDDTAMEESHYNVPEPPAAIEIEVPPLEIKQESPQYPLAEPESETPERGAPESEATQSGVAQSGVTQSGVTQSGVTQSGVTQSGVTQSEVPEGAVAEFVEHVKKEYEDAEDSLPLKEMASEETAPTEAPAPEPEPEVKEEPAAETETETHTETDDDTPMELSREEEKDGKKRRDYSRKKKPDSRTCSGSESAEASAPESPSASETERQHRLWKKSVMLVYSRLCAHKYASLFLRPISDEEAPGYSIVVRRPMDLTTIRRNIDAGVIRTTAEFQRDVLLMLSNALMYNSSEHSVYAMAREMHEEALCQLGMLLAAQAHAGLAPPAHPSHAAPAPPPRAPPSTRKRRRHDSPHAPAAPAPAPTPAAHARH